MAPLEAMDTHKNKMTATPDTPVSSQNSFTVSEGDPLRTIMKEMKKIYVINGLIVNYSNSPVFVKMKTLFQKVPHTADLWPKPLSSMWKAGTAKSFTIKLALQETASEEDPSSSDSEIFTPPDQMSPMKFSSKPVRGATSKKSKNTEV